MQSKRNPANRTGQYERVGDDNMKELLKNFLNKDGQLVAFPAKRKFKLCALIYLSQKFEKGKIYTEREANDLLSQWHTFGDPATLRRELYTHRFLNRDAWGKAYALEEVQPTLKQLEERYG